MTEGACFSEQLSVGNLWFTRTCVPNGKATCAPPVRTCALPTLRPFRILPSFLSQGLIKGGVLLRSGRTCVSASQVSCDQHWSWHLQSKWKQFWVCTDGWLLETVLCLWVHLIDWQGFWSQHSAVLSIWKCYFFHWLSRPTAPITVAHLQSKNRKPLKRGEKNPKEWGSSWSFWAVCPFLVLNSWYAFAFSISHVCPEGAAVRLLCLRIVRKTVLMHLKRPF